MTPARTVLVSILNWNTAGMTIDCVASVLQLQRGATLKLDIVVIDNASRPDDWERLQAGIDPAQVTLLRQERNLGFAGGHNVAIRHAIDHGADYVWLVNSDALLEPDTMLKMVALMESDSGCGSVSPVIRALHDDSHMDFCGARRDWAKLDSFRPGRVEEARALEAAHPQDMWLAGTVVMFRVAALAQVGSLNEKLFAYYEDDDIGVRLCRAGWRNRMAFDAVARHAQPNVKERPPHYFYLLYRNAFLFWTEHTPAPYRRFLRLRLLDRAVFTANRLYRRGLDQKAEACLLGILDGLQGRGGAPDLTRRPPLLIRILRGFMWIKQYRRLRYYEA